MIVQLMVLSAEVLDRAKGVEKKMSEKCSNIAITIYLRKKNKNKAKPRSSCTNKDSWAEYVKLGLF